MPKITNIGETSFQTVLKFDCSPCDFLLSELPFKAIFNRLDGSTTRPNTSRVVIGDQLFEDIHHKPQVNFTKISLYIKEGKIPDRIL